MGAYLAFQALSVQGGKLLILSGGVNLEERLVQRLGLHRLLILLSFFAFISLGLPDGLLGVAWPSISHTFGRPLSRLAVLQIAMTAGFFLSSTNAGRLIRSLGVGKLLIASNISIALALTGYSFGWTWPIVVGSSVLLGMGGGAVDAGMNAYAAQRFSKEEVTTLHAFYGVGAMLGPVVMRQVLEAEIHWQWGYRVTLTLILILLTLFVFSRALWYREKERSGRAEPESRDIRGSQTLYPRYLPALGVFLFLVYTGLEVTVGAWSFSLLTEGRGVDSGVAAVWVGAYWAALTGGRLFFGLLGSRWRAHAIVWSMILTGVLGAILFVQPWFPLMALLALPVLGFACAPLFPLFVSLTPSVVGEAQAPRLIGHQVAAANVGAALVPLIVGLAVEIISLEAVAYVMVLLTLALVAAYPAWIRHSRDSSPAQ